MPEKFLYKYEIYINDTVILSGSLSGKNDYIYKVYMTVNIYMYIYVA